MTIVTLPLITTHSTSPQALAAVSTRAKWISVTASVTILIGDSTINNGTGNGFTLAAGSVFEFPRDCDGYDLSQIYIILTSGNAAVMYGT